MKDRDEKIVGKILEEMEFLDESVVGISFEKFAVDEKLKRAVAMTFLFSFSSTRQSHMMK